MTAKAVITLLAAWIASTAQSVIAPASAQTPPPARQILLVLDASGSMTQKLPDGQPRFTAARSALATVIGGLNDEDLVALRVYGHQSTPDKRNCDDTELVAGFAPAKAQRAIIGQRLEGLRALGYTPISRSLERAAADFGSQRRGAARTIVLISDGRETCKSDPCALAAALSKADADLTIHTVGFGVDDAARQQLRCIAKVARGTYTEAGNGAELAARLAAAAAARPSPPVPLPPPRAIASVGTLKVVGLNQPETTVTNSTSGEGAVFTPFRDSLDLPPGIYTLLLANGPWPAVEIRAGETTEVSPAFFRVPRPAGVLQFVDPETGEAIADFHAPSQPLTAMVPGRYHIRTLEGLEWPQPIELRAGQTFDFKASVLRLRLDDLPPKDIVEIRLTPLVGVEITHVFDVNTQVLQVPAGRYALRFLDRPDFAPLTLDIGEDELREVDRPR